MSAIPPRPGPSSSGWTNLARSLRLIAAALIVLPVGHLPTRLDHAFQRASLRALHPVDRRAAAARLQDQEVTWL